MLSDPETGKVDLQQLLLYCCDSSEKAFAVLGFATKNMLTIDGLYELLHREPATPGLEPPEHLDPFSKAALKRLFDELKLGEAEKAPCPLVAKHPAGAALLEACISYCPRSRMNGREPRRVGGELADDLILISFVLVWYVWGRKGDLCLCVWEGMWGRDLPGAVSCVWTMILCES